MIELDFGKLLLLALIALIVLGPEKLPGAARTAGALLRRVRNGWDSVRAEVERELEIEEIRRTARETAAQAESARNQMRDAVQQVHDMAHDTGEHVQREVGDMADQMRAIPRGERPWDDADEPLDEAAPDEPPQAELPLEGGSNDQGTTMDLQDERAEPIERAPDPDHPDADGTLRRAPYGQPLKRRSAEDGAEGNDDGDA